jgi:hypothetical protein
MKYQLVLQWAESLIDYDSMILLEDSLIDGLPADCEVDGHDIGAGQVNIFVRTDNPTKTWKDIKNVVGEVWTDARVAYRDMESSSYTTLWPTNSSFTIL